MKMKFIVVTALVIAIDYITKMLAVSVFRVKEAEIIKDAVYFTYVENRGAAFGIFQNQRWLFISITILVILSILWFMLFKTPKSRMLTISLGMIAGGGIGNLIDRIGKGYVVDFIDFRFINFAVFNAADSFVVIGSILFCIFVLLFDKKGETFR